MTKSAEYMFDRALISLSQKRTEEASEILADVLKADATHARAWCIRGDLEHQAGRSFNAFLHLNAAVQFAPNMHEAWCNRGLIAAWIGCVGIAEDSYMESLRIKDNIESHINLGNLYTNLMRIDESAEQFRLALAINAEDPQSLTNLGMCCFAMRNWKDGLHLYRSRFRNPHFQPRPQINLPVWTGQEDLKGKIILAFGEQGYGDEMMSYRFCQTLRDLGARVLLCSRPPVYRLARTVTGADAVVHMYDEPGEHCDYCVALLDVPGLASATPETVPGKTAYLGPPPDRRILDLPDGFRVGICWSSGKRPLQPHLVPIQKAKSIPLEYLSFLQQSGVVLVSLQTLDMEPGIKEAKEKMGVIDPMGGVQDFADTAWIIDQLDMVITVDTSVAHLAGALGKPVWNLVRFDAIWPWMHDDDTTCWYDSMKIYRQPKINEWVDPIRRLKEDFLDVLDDPERCVAAAE